MRYCISEPRKNRLPKQFETLTVEFAKHRTRMLTETLKLVRQLALIIAFYHYQLVILMKRTRSQCDVDLIFALENFAVSKRDSIKQLGQLVPTRYDIFGQAGCTNSRVSLFRAWEAGRRRYGCWLAVKVLGQQYTFFPIVTPRQVTYRQNFSSYLAMGSNQTRSNGKA